MTTLTTSSSRSTPTPAPTPAATAAGWGDVLHSLLGIPATDGNEVRVLRNGDEIFPAMLDAIDHAERTVDIVTFVYWQGDIAKRFADSLAAAARRGCRVRVLLGAVGARKLADDLIDEMTNAGAEVRWFRPVLDGGTPAIDEVNHRTHRKILVCDGHVGFTGGVGIADEWTGDARDESEWRDTHCAVRGPAVAGLQAAFIDNWADTADEQFDAAHEPVVDLEYRGSSRCIVMRGASETGASDLWRLIVTLIQRAERRVRIQSAYFSPDDKMIEVMRDAVARGVEVQLMFPGEHADKRFVRFNGEADYAELLKHGIDIRTYERSMLHAKVITVDGAVASIGSANLNDRSMQHDEECNLLVLDPDVVAVLDRHFESDLERCVQLDPRRWADRGLLQRLGEKVSQIADHWL